MNPLNREIQWLKLFPTNYNLNIDTDFNYKHFVIIVSKTTLYKLKKNLLIFWTNELCKLTYNLTIMLISLINNNNLKKNV